MTRITKPANRRSHTNHHLLNKSNRWKRMLLISLAAAVTASPIAAASAPHHIFAAASAATADVQDQLIAVSESPITAGATFRTYTWKSMRNNKPISVNVKAIVADLTNPHVKLDVMTGTGGQFTKNQTVAGMVRETGAVAGINGDFYNTIGDGAPQGPQMSGGEVMSSAPFLSGFYGFALTKDRKPIIDSFSFTGTLNAPDGSTFPLGGINKAPYWHGTPSTHAMIDSMFIYTSAWGSTTRAVDRATDLLEVLVVDDVVQQIQSGSLKMTPPENGYIIRTEGKARAYVLEHLKEGDTVTYSYQLTGASGQQADSSNLELLIGGGTMITDEGQAVDKLSLPGSADAGSGRSRTSIGFSQDGRYVYLVTADHVAGVSDGATLKEMGRMMAQMGVWRALNMDGGGSTQMVSRPLGEHNAVVVNGLENAWQRPVVNGFGVYSTAPHAPLGGLIVSGPKFILQNEAVKFALKAYDQYYNPLSTDTIENITWQTSDPNSRVEEDGTLTMATKGNVTVTASSGNVSQAYDVQLIGANDIKRMTVVPSSGAVLADSTIKLSVNIVTNSGDERTLPGHLFDWELQGIEGAIEGDTLRVDSVADSHYARIIARYDGFGAMALLPIGAFKTPIDWDSPTTSPGIVFQSTDGVTGALAITDAQDAIQGQDHQSDNQAIEMKYDLSQGSTDTKAAYAAFPDGYTLAGEPQRMELLVRGDESLNWLRAEFTDANGAVFRADLARTVNWKGWKKVSVDLASLNMKSPVKLNRLYIASVAEGADERASVGSVAFDQFSFLYKTPLPAPPKNTALLKVGSKQIRVNDVEEAMDVAPVIIDNRTFVPIRFIADALGGDVQWEPNERRVTVIRGSQMIEMRIGSKELTVNGQWAASDVAPVIRQDRTLVPLRLLSEQFGWKVDWNGETREVTLS